MKRMADDTPRRDAGRRDPGRDGGERVSETKTDPALLRALYRNAAVIMTEDEIREQRISWVIGQTGATRAQVEAAIGRAPPTEAAP